MGVPFDQFKADVEVELGKLPKVSGSGQMYFSQNANKALVNAENHAKSMGDEYVSVEHIFLSLMKEADHTLKDLFERYHITKDGFLKVLSEVRATSALCPITRRTPMTR